MEPGGSELEPSLPTQDNPCLIVEDSQPDSGALEEDPESGYRTLLAKRLSNLQPHAHSPVLELISSPLGGKGCGGDGQQEGQSDGHPSSATVDSNQTQSSALEEHSQLLVCPLKSPKRALGTVNSESAGEDVGDSADSTTHCAQSEVGTSQFGLLELSESQGLGEAHESREETDTSGRVTESPQKQSNQARGQSITGENSLTPPGQDDVSKRSEVTSSCTTELQSREVTNEKKMTFHHFLLGQGSEVFPQEEDSQLSTQEDLFERDDTGSTVDSTVAEPETPGMPASTPANSLRLLHLSGHTTLVQESLSQNSVEFVAPSQDNFGPTPIIVPNSPTEQEDEPGDDEPMDTSVSPDEAEQPQKKEEEPMETDQLPTESFHAHPDPISSSPKSRNSPALVLEKTLPVPSQPEFSHDIFVPTPSLEASSSSVAESGNKEVPPKDSPLRPLETGSSKDTQAEPSRQEQHKANPCQSGPSVPEESFRLELSTNSEGSSLFQKTQGKEEEDDSELTQIEELGDSAGAATNDPSVTPASQTKEKDMGNATGTLQPNESSLLNVSEGPKAIKDNSIEQTAKDSYPSENAKAEKFADEDNDVSDVSNASVTGSATDMQRASEATALTKPSSLQSAEPAGSASPSSSSPNPQTVDLATTSSVQEGPAAADLLKPATSESAPSSSGIPKDADPRTPEEAMEIQSRSPEAPEESRSKEAVSIKASDQEFGQNAGKPEGDDVTVDTSEEEPVQMEEEKKEDEGSGLCLALSQSQAFSPEPMEEEESFPAPEEPSIPKRDSPPGVERQSVGDGEDVPSSVIVIEESERDFQKEDEEVTLQPNKAQTVSSQPVILDSSQDSANVPDIPDNVQAKGTKVDMMGDKSVPSSNGSVHQASEKSSETNEAAERTDKVVDTRCPGELESQSAENSAAKSLSDSSGEIPFHFTLPKEGELIRPAATATPPPVDHLKLTPRHSTPIEVGSCSVRAAVTGDVSRETAMTTSDIMAEESGGDGVTSDSAFAVAERDAKLSLRMKLVTPVNEESPESACFSLQKPALSEEEVSVATATTVAKAVTSPLRSPSVFSRVCEVRRQVEAAGKERPRTPTRGGLSEEGEPGEEGQKALPLRHVPCSRAPQESDQSSSRPPEEEAGQGSSVRQRAQRLSVREKEIQTDALASGRLEETATQTEGRPGLAEEEEERCSATVQTDNASRALLRQRAVSQQTSFDATGTPTLPRKLQQRAVSQQTSFDASGPRQVMSKGDPESPPPRPPPGQSVRRHVRTIREVRTVVTRIITDVYYEDGKEVDRTVTEESEEPLVDCRVVESDLSPSRTAGSMTSGDLGDVSSLSSKTPSLQRNSSGASSGGPGPARRMGAEDATRGFIMPPHRGASARLASPRKACGQQQGGSNGPGGSRGTEDRARELETGPLTPLTPRGRARRGRPTSRTPFSRECGTPTSRDGGQGLPSSSSEDEPYNQMCAHVSESPPEHRPLRRSNSPEFGVLPPQSPDTGGGASSFVGLRVVAKWSSNGYFYSGCITRDSGAGRFRLLFDDGYECDVLGKDILLCDPIPLETEVTALSEDEYFSAGVVKGHKKEGSDFFYCVEKDGQRKWYRRMAVILSLEQGNRLREQFGLGPYEPVTPLTKASDISLDNLVEGKRKRRGNVGASGTPTRGPSESPRAPGNTGKRKLINAAEEDKCPAKRGRKSACPKTGRRVEACNTSESGAELPSDPAELVETHGPLPQSATLFLGYAFLLTASSESDRETNQPGSEGEEEYVQTAPYNKHYTESQLRTGGGYILQDFNEGQCNAAYQSLLIADQYCRTQKYLLCVASGVPCVSHLWVQYCCRDNKLLNYKDYLLPAGVGLPDNRIVEWHPRRSPFQSLQVLLVSEHPVELWAELLMMGGASSVRQYKVDPDSPPISVGMFDLLVTDRSCPESVLKCAAALELPVVSPEWLIQSLIVGEQLAYDSQPQYRHDYTPPP
ncbi:TP53-binding protein 1 isoform X2 [Lepisosteus oculatus]|uniref:TP53-binding protein 1 isoform X2 n=1 Tax=Lepisosteus oculatus TaxID=7918 RepID=UPI003716CBEF